MTRKTRSSRAIEQQEADTGNIKSNLTWQHLRKSASTSNLVPRLNQLDVVSLSDDFTRTAGFHYTNLYTKYRPNSRLKKLEYSFGHSYGFLCVMVELYYTGRVKTRRNITRYFYSYYTINRDVKNMK